MTKSKLKLALDRFRQRDYAAEKDKKKRKQAHKRKQSTNNAIIAAESGDDTADESDFSEEIPDLIDAEAKHLEMSSAPQQSIRQQPDTEAYETSELEADDDEEVEDESDFDLSEIENEADLATPDVVPFQRLTINNKAALHATLTRIALPFSDMPFSEHLQFTSTEHTQIPDIDDDLKRELAFYSQALQAAKFARRTLLKEGVPFSRPMDYFAEMIKSDEHMDKIKAKLIDEAADKKASAEARKLRDLKKFGKQVQMAKLQEREKAKRQTLDNIQALKRKRQSGDMSLQTEEDMFDVALEDATRENKHRNNRDSGRSNSKRQKRDDKFGYGGKKRGLKRNDAASSGDVSAFSAKANKARSFGSSTGKKKAKRPGKSVRQSKRS